MLDPDHLLELAGSLADAPAASAPRQAVLRRAASTAYYAVFHALAGHIAGTFVSANYWKSRVLFYRSLDHGRAKERCKKLGKNPLPPSEAAFFEITAFEPGLRSFANTFVLLQELRHLCDYDPNYRIAKAQAQKAVSDATLAVANLQDAAPEQRNQFLAYILFGMRPQ